MPNGEWQYLFGAGSIKVDASVNTRIDASMAYMKHAAGMWKDTPHDLVEANRRALRFGNDRIVSHQRVEWFSPPALRHSICVCETDDKRNCTEVMSLEEWERREEVVKMAGASKEGA